MHVLKKTIFSKVLLLMVSLSLISGAFVLVIAIEGQARFIEDSLIEQHKVLAGITARSIEAGYLTKQWPFETIKQISEDENVLFLWVVKPSGEIHFADNPEIWGKKIDNGSLGTDNIVIKDNIFYETNEKSKLVIYPLGIKENGVPWTLYMGISLKSIAATRNKMIVDGLVCFALISVLAILMSLYFARYITNPIKKLTQACNKISMGDFKVKINVKTGDELEELAKSFKRLTKSIEILMRSQRRRGK
ncbi:MAG: HAMP domain-containing protein [Candidatus Aenigmatarchaeota archaeon]